jgi:hypothetical protein
MWQRFGIRKISWEFAVLGRVLRNRGRLEIFGSSEDDRRVVVICVTLTTSKPRLTSPSDMSSAGVLIGRCRITAFMGFRVEGVIGQMLTVGKGISRNGKRPNFL